MGGEDRAVDARRLGGAQERPDVLGILERVEHEDERRLVALLGQGEDVVRRGPAPRGDDEGDALVAVEPGDRGERPALDLDHGDAQARRVEHELLEGHPALRDDEQPARLAAGDERLLDGAASGDQLLALGERDPLERRARRATRIRRSPTLPREPAGRVAHGARYRPALRRPRASVVLRRRVVARLGGLVPRRVLRVGGVGSGLPARVEDALGGFRPAARLVVPRPRPCVAGRGARRAVGPWSWRWPWYGGRWSRWP